jgi:hypothetical protein
MTSARYVLHPGYIRSKNDGDEHFIGGPRLARLYGVRLRDCVYGDVRAYVPKEGDIHLRPRFDGDYRLPGFPPPPACINSNNSKP